MERFKKYLPVALFVLVAFLLLFFFMITKSSKPPVPTASPSPSAIPIGKRPEVTPGETSRQSLEEQIGQPVKNEGSTYYYKSAASTLYNVAEYGSNDQVLYFKEFLSTAQANSFSELISKYGQPEEKLYATTGGIEEGNVLYAYPSKGIALMVNPLAKKVWEVWHFEPTSYSAFRKSYAPDYTINQNEVTHPE